MRIAKYERAEFHDRDKTGEVEDLGVGISTIEDTGEVEEFCSLVDFCPESLFEGFLCGFEGGGFFDEVEVGKDTDDFGEAMGLEDVEKLEGFLSHKI